MQIQRSFAGPSRFRLVDHNGVVHSDYVYDTERAFILDFRTPRIPNEKKGTGWLYPKRYSRMILSRLRTQGYTRQTVGGMTMEQSGYLPIYASPTNLLFDYDKQVLEQQMVRKLLGNVKSQKVNFGVAYAEWNKTCNLVSTTARTIAASIVEIRRRNFKAGFSRLANQWGVPSSTWLEAMYGWRPLVADVIGSAEHLASLSVDQFRGTAKATVWRSANAHNIVGDGNLRQEQKTFEQMSYFGRLDYHPRPEFAQQLTSLGLTNPFSLGWELLPFSFVVDWFVPIGGWLDSLDATIGLEFKSGSYSYRHRLEAQGKAAPSFGEAQYRTFYRRRQLQREVYHSFPSVGIPLPPRPELGLKNALSGIALLFQAAYARSPSRDIWRI